MKYNKLKCGGLDKFIVIKRDDLSYLNKAGLQDLDVVLGAIGNGREDDGKSDNEYLVINTDEPYAGEIIEILKRNGRWG